MYTANNGRNSFTEDIKCIIRSGLEKALNAISNCAVVTYWNIGKRIVEEEQKGQKHAEYGRRLIRNLAEELTIEFGTNYSERNLRYYRQFYLSFKDMEIWNTRVPNLNWSHLRRISSVENPDARIWYANECARNS